MGTMGADSAEKMLRPVPAYSTDSLSASLSRCSVGSIPLLSSFCASLPAAALELAVRAAGRGACATGTAEAAWTAGEVVVDLGAPRQSGSRRTSRATR